MDFEPSNHMECLVELEAFSLHKIAYASDYKNVTVKRFLYHCGLRRTKEIKKDGIWWAICKVKDEKKWIIAKIKYGF
jgi:hypothetical protein